MFSCGWTSRKPRSRARRRSQSTPGRGTASANLQLLARQSQQGRFQGVKRDDVIYLIMPDRFADGERANNLPPGAAPGTYDRNAPKTYHGGDLKGIIDHLAYLKELGVTTPG